MVGEIRGPLFVLAKRSQYDRLSLNGDALRTEQAAQALDDRGTLELVRNEQHLDKFYHDN